MNKKRQLNKIQLERKRELGKIWARNHKEQKSIYNKKYYKLNKERINERNKKYHEKNPEVNLRSVKRYFEKMGKKIDMSSMEFSYALQAWAKTIKKLDNNICKNCDSPKNLNAHHIMPKSEFPELSLDLDNGVTLCDKCHGEMHGYKIY